VTFAVLGYDSSPSHMVVNWSIFTVYYRLKEPIMEILYGAKKQLICRVPVGQCSCPRRQQSECR